MPQTLIVVDLVMLYAGWGSTYAGSPSSPTLQQAELPIVDHGVCAKRNGHIFPVVESQMICAGGNGKVKKDHLCVLVKLLLYFNFVISGNDFIGFPRNCLQYSLIVF